MAVAVRERAAELASRWHRSGYELDLGIGITKGFATIGAIGFEGRSGLWRHRHHHQPGRAALRRGQFPGGSLISPRLLPEVEQIVDIEEVGLLTVKGLADPVQTLNIVRLRGPA